MTAPTTADQQLTIAVIGAGGKMGMRVSNNLQRARTTSATSRTHRPGSSAPSRPAARSPTRPPPSRTPTSSSSPCPDVALGPVSGRSGPAAAPAPSC